MNDFDGTVKRSASAGSTPKHASGPYRFSNGNGQGAPNPTEPPNWWKVNGVEVRSEFPNAAAPEGANLNGRWLLGGSHRIRHRRRSLSKSSRKSKKSSKRVFRKKSRLTRRR
jgi:hypothetical protein